MNNIKDSYQNYQSLVQDELKYLRTGGHSSPSGFNREREKSTNSIIEEIEKLETYTRQNTTDKITGLHEIGIKWRRMTIGMTGAFLIFGIVISLLINRSITHPLSLLERKTKEIGKGNFKRGSHSFHSTGVSGFGRCFQSHV